MMLQRSLIVALFLMPFYNADAQLYFGMTGDFGSKVKIHPDPGSLLKSTSIPSVSLTFLSQQEIKNKWQLLYGGAAGLLRYQLDLAEFDTLAPSNQSGAYFQFPDIAFYANTNLAIGRQFRIRQKQVFVFFGGGISYYFDYEIGARTGPDSSQVVFEYNIQRDDRKIKGFLEGSAMTNLSPRISLGIRYRYHINPALKGHYNFYYRNEPPRGTLALTQRTFSILFLVKI